MSSREILAYKKLFSGIQAFFKIMVEFKGKIRV